MKIKELQKEELKNINGGTGRYDETYKLGEKIGDSLAGLVNGVLTIISLRSLNLRGLKK